MAGIALPQSSLPIGYEFSAELSFPVHESVANGLLLFNSQVISSAFYIAFGVLTYGSTSTTLSTYADPNGGLAPTTMSGAGAAAGGMGDNGSVFEKNAQLLWWFSAAICLVATLSLLPVRSRYRRLALDNEDAINGRRDCNVRLDISTSEPAVTINQINGVQSKPETQGVDRIF